MATNIESPLIDLDLGSAFDSPERATPVPTEVAVENPGRWPRMLVLDEDVEERLKIYLRDEISHARTEKSPLIDDWDQWQRDYWAKPAQTVKNFPFKRAANVVIPLNAIAVEAIYARLLNTIWSVEPFVSIRPKKSKAGKMWADIAPWVEDWLQEETEDPNSLSTYEFTRESLLELIKLGTGVGKSGYEREVRKRVIHHADGTDSEEWIEVKNGATLDHVPLANFLMRLHENDPQSADWCGEEHDMTWSQLKKEAIAGRIFEDAPEEIKAWWSSERADTDDPRLKYEDTKDELANVEPEYFQQFHIQEIWLRFDVDGDDVDEEIVVDYHYASDTLLSIRYNWHAELWRPYRIGVFLPFEGRWCGLGVGKQTEQFQPLVTAIHRQRLDAGTLANMGMLAIKKGSGYGPGEPIFPGKMWFFDNPDLDIKEFRMSDSHHLAQLNNEQSATHWHEKRIGYSELMLGAGTRGTPATATSDLARLEQGNMKFDSVLKNVKRWYGLLYLDVVSNFHQFGNQGRHWDLHGEDGDKVEQFFSMPISAIRNGAFIELTITDSTTNREVEQQKWAQAFALLTQHYDKAIERAALVAQTTQDPRILVAMSHMALKASNTAIKRMLDAGQVPDVESFLLDIGQLTDDELDRVLNAAQGPAQLIAGLGGPAGVGGPPAVNGGTANRVSPGGTAG